MTTRPHAAFFAAIVLLVAGCFTATDESPADDSPPTIEPGNRFDVTLLGTSGHPAREVHLSAHPTDPGILLAAWQEAPNESYGWNVWAAITTDGGATWRTTDLHDPARATRSHAFDPTTAFSPTGAAYVLYGGESDFPVTSRMTLASSSDLGRTWTYSHVVEDPGPLFWDAMDLAVAPDTGRLHVVAQSVSARGVWHWSSRDGGASWSLPRPVHTPVGPEGYGYWPRVAAGAGGLVIVAAKGVSPPGAQYVSVSRDGGDTFELPRLVHESGEGYAIGDPLALHPGNTRVDLAYSTTPLAILRSSDGARTFDAVIEGPRAPAGLTPIWAVSAADADGTLHVLHSAGSAEPPQWWLAWTRVGPDGEVGTVEMAEVGAHRPPHPMSAVGGGDEYGGIAVAVDGSVYAAWSDPRVDGGPRIGFARLG